MNVFDFDKTIYDGDSTMGFLMYLIPRRPALWRFLPGFAVNALLFALRLRKKQDFKERMFRAFFGGAGDVERCLNAFWDSHMGGVMDWYRAVHSPDDLVITASPVDLVRPCCEKLGIKNLLGSPVDLKTGRYYGNNCHGEEKVRVFREKYPGAEVENFYSDSHSDDPMARIAQKAWLIRNRRVEKWTFK